MIALANAMIELADCMIETQFGGIKNKCELCTKIQ